MFLSMKQLDKESRESLNYNYENDYELIYRIREENEDEALQDCRNTCQLSKV